MLNHEIKSGMRILTPSNPNERGCQLSLFFTIPVSRVHMELEKLGVIVDLRKPNVLRVAPTPLYNCFEDVWNFVNRLKIALVAASN